MSTFTKACFVLTSMALASGVSAHAAEWKRVELRSAKGTRIQLNYQVQESRPYEGAFSYVASPLWINVKNTDAKRLRVVFLNFALAQGDEQKKLKSTTQVDLNRDGERAFAGRVTEHGMQNGVEILSSYQTFDQEIAIVDEQGNWEIADENGSHNFKLDLSRAAGLK